MPHLFTFREEKEIVWFFFSEQDARCAAEFDFSLLYLTNGRAKWRRKPLASPFWAAPALSAAFC